MNFVCKTLKRSLCLLLTLAMVISFASMNVFAASETVWSNTQYSGSCGKNNTSKATYKFMKATNPEIINNVQDYERIVISGTGETEDYSLYTNGRTSAPWYDIIWDTNSIVVEEGITCIGNNFFIGADSICYLSLPDSLQSIGHYAFSSALKYVKKVTIPENVTYIGQYAFASNKITEVEILGDVTVLQESVFSFCESLKSITIPKSVTSIEDYAFDYCTSLKDVYYDGTRAEWEEINIGYGNSYLLNATVHFPTVNVESVALDKTSKTMFVGSSFNLIATVLPEDAENKTISWKSSNTSVASVNNGVVTAVSPGTATITVTTADGNKTATCIVSVQASTVSVTDVSLNKSELDLQLGNTETLTATVSPTNATNKNVTWSSSNSNVASVSSSGVVTAKNVGTAIITVTTVDGGKTDSCSVNITPTTVSVTSVSLNKTSAAMNVGGTETLTATVSPTNATDKTVTWTSSNPSVASVSNGVITAKAAGTATITATTVDGNKTATCVVTVNAIDEDMPSLKIDDITVAPGEDFYVDIVAENCDMVKAITVNDIEYSESLTLTNAEWLLSGSTLSSVDINGDSLIAFQNAVDANKAVMRLYFTADSEAIDGDAYIRYKAMGTDASNKNFEFVEYEGKVKISRFIVGDCDGDEAITVDDAIYLAFYTFYPSRYPLPTGMNVDFDKDGAITVDDAIHLAFHTFYPDRYPLN